MSEADLPAWFERLSDREAASLAGDPIAESIDAAVQGLAYHRAAFRNKDAIRWSIVPDELGVSVGSLGFSEFQSNERAASVGAAVGRGHWGQGIATRAGRLALAYAFSTLQLQFVWAVALPENARIIRVLNRLGFIQSEAPEAIIRDVGERTDALYYSVRGLQGSS